MALFNELTQTQQDDLLAWLKTARPLSAELARVLEKFQAVVAQYGGNIETILGLLDGTAAIPNSTDLAGAQEMTKDEVVTLTGYLITSSSTASVPNAEGSYNTNFHRSLYAKAAGAVNLITG